MHQTPYKQIKKRHKDKMEKEEFFAEFKETLIEELKPVLEEIGKVKLALQILKDKVKTAAPPEKELKTKSPGMGTYKEKPKTNRPTATTSEYNAIYQHGTEKAVLLLIDGVDMWMPRGCVKSEIIEIEDEPQTLTIQDWIVKEKLK